MIDPNYLGDPYDQRVSIDGFKMAREIMRQPAFKPFVIAKRLNCFSSFLFPHFGQAGLWEGFTRFDRKL